MNRLINKSQHSTPLYQRGAGGISANVERVQIPLNPPLSKGEAGGYAELVSYMQNAKEEWQ
jgi:hypothetical protein